MILTKKVCRGALFYNTWEALVLLQVNTVASRKYSIVNSIHAVVDCCTLCTTVLVALILNNFEHRDLRIEIPLYEDVLVGVLNLHRNKKTQARTGERCEYP